MDCCLMFDFSLSSLPKKKNSRKNEESGQLRYTSNGPNCSMEGPFIVPSNKKKVKKNVEKYANMRKTCKTNAEVVA